MSARQLKEILVRWEVFNFKVWVVIGPLRYLPAYVKKRHRRVYKLPKDAHSFGGLYFHSKPFKGGILWLETNPRTPTQIGFLAHEVAHAVMDMHTTRAINHDEENDEPFCYAIAHGVEEILKGCK